LTQEEQQNVLKYKYESYMFFKVQIPKDSILEQE
jgi:hypothetical protein